MKKTMNHCSKNGPKTEKQKFLHCFILIFCACFQGSKPTWIPDHTCSGPCLLVLVHDLTCLDPRPLRKVNLKSYLPRKKIYSFQTSRRGAFFKSWISVSTNQQKSRQMLFLNLLNACHSACPKEMRASDPKISSWSVTPIRVCHFQTVFLFQFFLIKY